MLLENKGNNMQVSNERLLPDHILKDQKNIYIENMSRYHFVGQFVNDKVVLDVGCGTGIGTAELLKRKVKKIVGIDDDESAIHVAKKEFEHSGIIEFYAISGVDISFPDNSFEIVCALDVIEHVEDDMAFLSEVKRVLTHEGLLIISTPNKRITSPGKQKPYCPYHVREYYFDEFKTLLDSQELIVEYWGQHLGKYNRSIINKLMDSIPKQLKYLFPISIQNILSSKIRPNLTFEHIEITKDSLINAKTFIAVCRKQ